MPVSTDGEITTRTPARFEVVPRALSVLVPASYGSRPQDEVALHAAQ
jgi:diacylglycerol kinase family enzyme